MFSTRVFFTVIIAALFSTAAFARADTGSARLSGYTQPDLPVFRKAAAAVAAAPAAPVRKRVRPPRRRSSIGSGGTAGRFDTLIRDVARRHGVDYKLVKAVIHAESAFDHLAVSRVGAQGLMQLMPATARDLRVSDPFDPRDNVEGGTRYLKQMLRRFRNDISLCLAAYNAGPSTVLRYGGVPPYRETRSYIRRVKALMRRYEREEQALLPPQAPVIPVAGRVYHVIRNGRPVVSATPLP